MAMRHRLGSSYVAAGLCFAVALTGCGFAGRGVGSQAPAMTLSFGNLLDDTREIQPFVDAVARLSGGTLSVEVQNGVLQGDPAHREDQLIEAVAAGRYDLGWVAQRPWPVRGSTTFDPLVAPFLIDTYAAEQAVLLDPLADEMLSGVVGRGLTGVGILPGPLRMVASKTAIKGPADFAGKTVGIDDTTVAAGTLSVLGAKTEYPSDERIPQLDAVVAQLGAIYRRGWHKTFPFVAVDPPLWPRPLIIIGNTSRIDALSRDQRQALLDAVRATIPVRGRELFTEDATTIVELCEEGEQLEALTGAEREALRAAVQPAYSDLANDPKNAKALERIAELKASIPRPAPAQCHGDTLPSASSNLAVGFPDGTYRMTISADEIRAWWEANDVPVAERYPCPCEGGFTVNKGVWTGEDGSRWEFSFAGDHITIYDAGRPDLAMTMRWAWDGHVLTFSEMVGGTWGDRAVWTVKPWVRTG